MSQDSAILSHQFDDLGQQKEADTLGMWIFLMTEIMLFGAIFTGYIIYRHEYYYAFADGSKDLYTSLGVTNTVVLLTSSLFMALAVRAAHHGNTKWVVRHLILTMLLGLVFLIIKGTEYTLEWHDHVVPVFNWQVKPEWGDHADMVKLFFVFYFIMTLLHALHMICGLTVVGIVCWLSHRGKFSKTYYNPVEITGLYWHFVDIVWVFLLPTLYLVNPR